MAELIVTDSINLNADPEAGYDYHDYTRDYTAILINGDAYITTEMYFEEAPHLPDIYLASGVNADIEGSSQKVGYDETLPHDICVKDMNGVVLRENSDIVSETVLTITNCKNMGTPTFWANNWYVPNMATFNVNYDTRVQNINSYIMGGGTVNIGNSSGTASMKSDGTVLVAGDLNIFGDFEAANLIVSAYEDGEDAVAAGHVSVIDSIDGLKTTGNVVIGAAPDAAYSMPFEPGFWANAEINIDNSKYTMASGSVVIGSDTYAGELSIVNGSTALADAAIEIGGKGKITVDVSEWSGAGAVTNNNVFDISDSTVAFGGGMTGGKVNIAGTSTVTGAFTGVDVNLLDGANLSASSITGSVVNAHGTSTISGGGTYAGLKVAGGADDTADGTLTLVAGSTYSLGTVAVGNTSEASYAANIGAAGTATSANISSLAVEANGTVGITKVNGTIGSVADNGNVVLNTFNGSISGTASVGGNLQIANSQINISSLALVAGELATPEDSGSVDIVGSNVVISSLNHSGTVKVDSASSLTISNYTAGPVGSSYEIIIDAAGFTSGVKKVVDLNNSITLSGYSVINLADGVSSYVLSDGDIVLATTLNANYKVNSTWSSRTEGELIETGFMYGVNAFSNLAAALAATNADTADNTIILAAGDYSAASGALAANDTIQIAGTTTSLSDFASNSVFGTLSISGGANALLNNFNVKDIKLNVNNSTVKIGALIAGADTTGSTVTLANNAKLKFGEGEGTGDFVINGAGGSVSIAAGCSIDCVSNFLNVMEFGGGTIAGEDAVQVDLNGTFRAGDDFIVGSSAGDAVLTLGASGILEVKDSFSVGTGSGKGVVESNGSAGVGKLFVGDSSSQGILNVVAGTFATVANESDTSFGKMTVAANSAVNLAGTGILNIVNTSTINGAMSIADTALFDADAAVTLGAGATLDIEDNGAINLAAAINVNGAMTLADDASMTAASDIVIGATGSVAATGDAVIAVGGTINNNGTLSFEMGNTITFNGYTGTGTIAISDLANYNGKDAIKVLDYTGTGTLTDAHYAYAFGASDLASVSKHLAVRDSDLWLLRDASSSFVSVYINSTYTSESCDGHTFGVDAFCTLADALAVEPRPFEITYTEGNGDVDTIVGFDGIKTTIDSGNFYKNFVFGGNGQNNNITSDVATDLTINSGTYKYTVAGGNYVRPATSAGASTAWMNAANSLEGVELKINGGTFNSSVIGGDYVRYGGVSNRIGDIYLEINGGTFNKFVSGGSYMNAATSNSYDRIMNVCDINIVINGGTFNDNIYGGNVVSSTTNNANTTVSGDINMTFDTSAAAILVDGSVYGGSFGKGIVDGDVTMTITGSNALTVTGSICGGNSHSQAFYTLNELNERVARRVEDYVSGKTSLVFDGFTSVLGGMPCVFTDIVAINNSQVEFSNRHFSLEDASTWTLETGSSLAGLRTNDFKGDAIEVKLAAGWDESECTLLSGVEASFANFDLAGSVKLGNEDATWDSENSRWASASYQLALEDNSMKFGLLSYEV